MDGANRQIQSAGSATWVFADHGGGVVVELCRSGDGIGGFD